MFTQEMLSFISKTEKETERGREIDGKTETRAKYDLADLVIFFLFFAKVLDVEVKDIGKEIKSHVEQT